MTSEIKDSKRLKEVALNLLQTEADAILEQRPLIDEQFIKACEISLQCRGRVIVTGMGKSGHIAGKIAATLASTGTPAFFVHPGEASHGDLGMITGSDVVLALSNSGETDELLIILPIIKRLGVPLIAMTGNPTSKLAQASTIHMHIKIQQEACPLGLAPTASTTATLAMGDALAVALLEARDFTEEDFARSHPAGSLGRRLLLRVNDIMHQDGQLPIVSVEASLDETLLEMSSKGLGMTAILSDDNKLLGVFTDGDLRRLLVKHPEELNRLAIGDVIHSDFVTIHQDELAAQALQLMDSRRINALPVVDDSGKLTGAINMHDLLRAGVV